MPPRSLFPKQPFKGLLGLDMVGRHSWIRQWGAKAPVLWCATFEQFLRLIPTAELGLFAVSGARLTLGILRRLRPFLITDRIILLVPFSPHVVRTILDAGLPARPIVWLNEGARGLDERIQEYLEVDVLSAFGDELIRVRSLAPILRSAIRMLCRERPPPKSFGSMARGLGVAESTFRYHWKKQLPDLHHKQIHDWAILIRAREHASRLGWRRAACWAGVHHRTLCRTAFRLTHEPLEGLGDKKALDRSFQDWGLHFLLHRCVNPQRASIGGIPAKVCRSDVSVSREAQSKRWDSSRTVSYRPGVVHTPTEAK